MADVIGSGGRRRSSAKRALGWGLAVVAVLAPCVTIALSPTAHGEVRSAAAAPPSGSLLPVLPVVSAQVVTEPGDGAGEVSPTAPVGVSVSHGQLDAVVLTSSAGRVV
ncbi:MAG TPA: hypothetical protein VGJ13_03885, partial [Pseudonocardiaceae bacterium]